jgi:hypothetical protein
MRRWRLRRKLPLTWLDAVGAYVGILMWLSGKRISARAEERKLALQQRPQAWHAQACERKGQSGHEHGT